MTKKSKRASKRKKELTELEANARAGSPAALSPRATAGAHTDSPQDDVLKEYERIIDTEQRRARDADEYDYDATAYSPPNSPPPPASFRRQPHADLSAPEPFSSRESLAGRSSQPSLAEPKQPSAGVQGGRQAADAGAEQSGVRYAPQVAEPLSGSPPKEHDPSPVLSVADSHLHDLEHAQGGAGQAPSPRPRRAGRKCSCCGVSSVDEQQRERHMHRSDSSSSMGKQCRHCKYLQACLDRERANASQHRLKIERNNSSMITLNVGGNVFTTSINTLVSDNNSMLSAMFSGKYAAAKDEHGRYFIDRDGTHFRFVLNFLRDGTVRLPDDLQSLQELMQEAQYYQISGLIAAVAEAPRLSKNEYITIRYLPANTYDGWPIRIEGPLEPHIICELHGGALPPDRETADVRNMYGQPSTGWKVRGMFLTKIFNIIASYGWQLATSNGSGGGKQRNFAEMYVFSRSKLMRRKRLQRKRRSASYTYNHLFAMPASYGQPRPAAHGIPPPAQPLHDHVEGYFSPEEEETDGHQPPRQAPGPLAPPAIPVTSDEEPMAILLPVNVSGGAGVPVPAEQFAPGQMNV